MRPPEHTKSWYDAVLSLLLIGSLCAAAILNSDDFVNDRLEDAVSSASADVVRREITSTFTALERIEKTSLFCTPLILSQLQELVEGSPYIYKAQLKSNNSSACTANNSSNSSLHGLTLSSNRFQIALNPNALRKILELPWWLNIAVEDDKTPTAPFWTSDRKALLAQYGDKRMYVTLQNKTFWTLGLIVLWASASLILINTRKGTDYLSNIGDARLLKKLLSENRLNIHYQPIVDLKTKRWVGAEALLRCTDKTTEAYYPAPFLVEIAQKNGMSNALIREVCKKVATDYNCYLWSIEDFYISINLTAHDLKEPTLPEQLKTIFDEHQMAPSRLIFEITETSLVEDETAIENVFRLKKMGFKVALDDFATGYCGLQYLEKFPVDIIKLDASFVRSSRHRMVKYAASLAKLNKVRVIAEGIETKDQANELLSEGIPFGQGWYYAATMSAETFIREYYTNNQKDSVYLQIL